MVKTPKTRHSKQRRDPVTIDLGPGEVSRFEEPKPATDDVTTPADMASDHPDAASADDGLPPEPEVGKKLEESAERDFLNDDLKARTQSEPRYAAGFGRSPGVTADFESEPGQEDPQPQAAPVGPARRGGALAAGLLGGLIALAGAGGLQFAGVLPSPGSSGNANVAGLQAEIDALRRDFDGLKNAPGAGGVEELRQSLGESAARVEGLSTTVEQLKSDLAGLRKTVEAEGGGAAGQALDARIKEIEASLAALGQNGGSASAAALDAISQKIASVEGALDAATKASAAADARLATLEQTVEGLSRKVEAQADQPRIALAIAASALKAAVDRGGPFAAEAETFAAVAPKAPELPELRALAEKGVPSRADLIAAMPGAATAMIDASKVVDVNAGFFERLLSSAESLVKVRPIGAVEGEGAPAKVARMEAALRDGNLAKALAEYDTLPEPSKAAGAGFADAVRSRLKAEELVDKALAGALKAS